MKMMLKPMLFLFLITLTCLSCNNEELFVEPTADVVDPDVPVDTEDPVEDPDNTSDPVDTTLPCMFTLSTVQAGDTVIINCMMDLEGQTITLPSSVTIVYEGGDIINGTLNFSDNSVISGELLNSTVILGGSNPQVKDPVFEFIPSRWGIVEGWTTSDIAQNNNNILDGTMLRARNMGVTTFIINKMDAYFETSFVTSTTTNQNYYASEGVNVPSNFELIMSDETILRQYPVVGSKVPSLLVVVDAENVTIRGGVLYGDRDIRVYNKPNEEYGSHLLTVRSGRNVVLDGIKFTMASVGGLNINSIGFSFNPDYNPTNNVLVKNCIFIKNRMMSLALTDGNNIVIENNQFIDTALPTDNSDAGVVRWAINFEPVRSRDQVTGELIEYQRVHNITVRNNKERGSANGGFLVFAGQHITFENNDMENQIAYSFGSNIKILNNTFNASETSRHKPGISIGAVGETVFDNLISGNIINGYGVGIYASFKNAEIVNNTINESAVAVQFNKTENMNFHNNKIISSLPTSRGFVGHVTSVNNVNIYDNELSVVNVPFGFTLTNQEVGQENYSNRIYNNISYNPGSNTGFNRASGFEVTGNILNGPIWVTDTKNIKLNENTIDSNNNHGILLKGPNYSTTVNGNVIKTPISFECINIDSANDLNELSITNSSCN